MSAYTSIDAIADLIADEGQFPARMGHRDMSSPSFIFFDDDRSLHPDIRWGREMALDFEEWVARNSDWDENALDEAHIAFNDRQEARRYANWVIDFHRKQARQSNNDYWRKMIMPLMNHLDDPEILTIVKTVRDNLPFAPGPIGGTIFVNPDGSKFKTSGTSPGSAKAGFQKRHGLENALVSMERVQKEGEKQSFWVIGQRKSSAETPSNYYDPNAEFGEDYEPHCTTLHRVPASKVFSGHRLTVRELEQSLIAGSEFAEDDIDACVNAIETSSAQPDDRTFLMNSGYGDAGRTEEALSEHESYLYGVLRMFGHSLACELILLAHQEEGLIHNFFMSCGNYSEDLLSIIRYVKDDDKVRAANGEEPMLPYVQMALLSRNTIIDEEELVA